MPQGSGPIFEGREDEAAAAIHEVIRTGRAVSDEQVAELRSIRLESLERLQGLSADEAQERLAQRVQPLEASVQAIEDGRVSHVEAVNGELFDLGERLRWNFRVSDFMSGDLSHDPLFLVEEELSWAARAAGHIRRWDPKLQDEVAPMEAAADQLKNSILSSKLERFLDDRDLQPVDSPLGRAFTLWFAASESYAMEIAVADQAVAARYKAEVQERGLETVLSKLAGKREEYGKLCRQALAECNLTDAGEFCSRVASALTEGSLALLTERSASQLPSKIPVLRILQSRVVFFAEVIAPRHAELLRRGGLSEDRRLGLKLKLRRVERVRKQALHEEREEKARLRLTRFFGVNKVETWKNFILLLIFGFLALVVGEWALLSSIASQETLDRWIPVFHTIDLGFCLLFQVDFFVRWGFARWRGWYFWHHFFIESLPALPYGLLLPHLQSVTLIRAVRLQRFARLLRFTRAFIFLVRGIDRAIERLRPCLDRDIVLFERDPLQEADESALYYRVLETLDRCRKVHRQLYGELPWSRRAEFLHRYVAALNVEARFCAGLRMPYRREPPPLSQEIKLEKVIARCLDCDVARSITYFGREGAQRVARWVSFLDLPIFRRVPLIRRLVRGARMSDSSETASHAVRTLGQVLQEALGVIRFWGDVAGITTGPQILDRVASAMVIAAQRPAIRLLLVGGVFLLLHAVAGIVSGLETDGTEQVTTHVQETTVTAPAVSGLGDGDNSDSQDGVRQGNPEEQKQGMGRRLAEMADRVFSFLGVPILILGSICLVFFILGLWLKRIAGEALDVHLRRADAHFYSLVKHWKLHRSKRDLRKLFRTVLRPECRLRQVSGIGEEDWVRFLAAPVEFALDRPRTHHTDDARWQPFLRDRQTVTLYYEMFLDGPILHRSDDGTSVQLLGNLTLNDIRTRTLGMSKREIKRLEKLSLDKTKMLNFGPYFWFRFITESLAIETAKLVEEYNLACIPLDRMAFADDAEKERFEEFLARRSNDAVRLQRARRRMTVDTRQLVTDEFTSLHFLAVDRGRDEQVRQRFGDEVLAALRRDRRGVVRDIFGTRPYHLLPRSQRVFNPYRLYHRYLGGAKFLLLPLFVLWGFIKLGVAALWQLVLLVKEVLGRDRRLRAHGNRTAHFDVAVRKINRMRKPFFMEALKLRLAVDLDYLGLNVPGTDSSLEFDEESVHTFEHDLDFVGARQTEREPLEKFRQTAQRDLRGFRSYLDQRGWSEDNFVVLFSTLDPSGELLKYRGEVLRALATAYVTNHESLRSVITAPAVAKGFIEGALQKSETIGFRIEHFLFGTLLWFRPRRRRRKHLLRRYLNAEPTLAHLDSQQRYKLDRLFFAADDPIAEAVSLEIESATRRDAGEDFLLSSLQCVARDHAAWTNKVITVRTLQTVTVLDIDSYRDLVWKVGSYEEESNQRSFPVGVGE